MFGLTVETNFAAAHKLCGYQGACANLHGHTWKAEVNISGERLNSLGMLIDFKELKKILAEITDHLDHQCINDIAPFNRQDKCYNPTAENIAQYLFTAVKTKVKGKYPEIRVNYIKVWESPQACATYQEV